MKLQEGIYENIITSALQHDMMQTEESGLICKQEDIDGAENPSMLANHIGKLVLNRLSDEALSADERANFVNRLIDFLGEDVDEKVVDNKQMLAAVVNQTEEAQIKATKQGMQRPLTGFRTSSLFTGGQSKVYRFQWQQTYEHQLAYAPTHTSAVHQCSIKMCYCN